MGESMHLLIRKCNSSEDLLLGASNVISKKARHLPSLTKY